MPSGEASFPIKAHERETVKLRSTVLFDAVGAITSQTNKGFTLAKTGTGAYDLTLDRKYPQLRGISFAVFKTTGVDANWQRASGLTTNNIVSILRTVAGTATDAVAIESLDIEVTLGRATE